ncbi:MAG: DUF4116 domain-containing protein [Pasteurella sp.]|nr:DUF4116 domain-containing protein [Pasteurella sp.]
MNTIDKEQKIREAIIRDRERRKAEKKINKAVARVKFMPHDLRHLSDEFRNNRRVVAMAVQKEGRCLEYASERLRADREIVMIALENHKESLKFASEALKKEFNYFDIDKWQEKLIKVFTESIPKTRRLHLINPDDLALVVRDFYNANKSRIKDDVTESDFLERVKETCHWSDKSEFEQAYKYKGQFVFLPDDFISKESSVPFPKSLYKGILEKSTLLALDDEKERSYYLYQDNKDLPFINSILNFYVSPYYVKSYSDTKGTYVLLNRFEIYERRTENLGCGFTPETTGLSEEKLLELVRQQAQNCAFEIFPLSFNDMMKKLILSEWQKYSEIEFIYFDTPKPTFFGDIDLESFNYVYIDYYCGFNELRIRRESSRVDIGNIAFEYSGTFEKYDIDDCSFFFKFICYKSTGNSEQIKYKYIFKDCSGIIILDKK